MTRGGMSIYAGPPIRALLDGHDENRSARLNTVAERYAAIVAAHTPELSEAEWCAVCDALNGCFMGAGEALLGVRYAWANVADCEGLGTKWGVDQDALAQRLRTASLAEQVSVAEVVQRFSRNTDLALREALELAGARISGDAPRRTSVDPG